MGLTEFAQAFLRRENRMAQKGAKRTSIWTVVSTKRAVLRSSRDLERMLYSIPIGHWDVSVVDCGKGLSERRTIPKKHVHSYCL